MKNLYPIECVGDAGNKCFEFVVRADPKYRPEVYKGFNILAWALHYS
jgi:hypothetical protein